MPQSSIWSDFTLTNLLLLSCSLWHERISSHLKLSIFMQTRHFTDVPLPIQQKCSFHFHKHDENNISSEICTLEVLLINLHFKECKGFIWKKKKKRKSCLVVSFILQMIQKPNSVIVLLFIQNLNALKICKQS